MNIDHSVTSDNSAPQTDNNNETLQDKHIKNAKLAVEYLGLLLETILLIQTSIEISKMSKLDTAGDFNLLTIALCISSLSSAIIELTPW